MVHFRVGALTKVALVGAIALGAAFGVLNARQVARAQDMTPQSFVVQAGAGGPGNGDLLAFAPQSLQVHKGDTVTWAFAGFHNVHFGSEPVPLVVESEVNGETAMALNPFIPFPTIESGSSYSGGEISSGLPLTTPVFSLVIDLEPGTYSYLCDIHPGMVATLTVVEDNVAIPGAVEVSLQAGGEIGAAINAGMETFGQLTESMAMTPDGDTVNIQAGSDGAVTLNDFFPFTAVISAGQSVTWTVPAGSFDPHTVSMPSLLGQDFTPVEVEGAPPVLVAGPALIPTVPSGSEVGADTAFNSGLLLPGQSYTLTFTEPGVYSYVCSLHVGMQGTIVVQPS